MTAKLEQVLEIDPPDELEFHGRFNDSITTRMRLTNPSDKRVMFKIKTTAPKKYCVRPNSGILCPNGSLEISISLQPCMYDPSEKGKHKFMVQSAFAPPGDVNMEKIWKDIIPEHLMDTKLKCTFEIDSNEDNQAEPHDFTPNMVSTPLKTSAEIQKVTTEVLRNIQKEEESYLKVENQRLRDQIAKLQTDRNIPPVPVKIATTENSFCWSYLFLALVLAMIGIICGKYFF